MKKDSRAEATVGAGRKEARARTVMIQPWARVTCAPGDMWCRIGARGWRRKGGVVVGGVVEDEHDDDGSEVRGEVFADTTSFSKTGIAAGVTATATKMRMVDSSTSPDECPQTYIFQPARVAQIPIYTYPMFCPSKEEERTPPLSLSPNPSLAQILGILRA